LTAVKRTAHRRFLSFLLLAPMAIVACLPRPGHAQTVPPTTEPADPDLPKPEPLPPPTGKVLFSTEQHPPAPPPAAPVSSSQTEEPAEPGPPDVRPVIRVTDAERAAIAITAYTLDVHLVPASSREEVRAELTVRNLSHLPVTRIPLQLSSTLRWQTIGILQRNARGDGGGVQAMPFTQSPIATDADHTGYAQEAVLTLAPPDAPGYAFPPLAPGDSLTLAVFYSGALRPSAARLELIGAPSDRAAATDWDGIVPTSDDRSTALRGFGDVLWYPVSAPIAVFGDANKLFELIREQRLRNASSLIALNLTVEYVGDPPDAVIFDSHLQPLTAHPDTTDELVSETRGLATASFAAAPIGFRAPSLFLTAQSAENTADELLSVITPDENAAAPYAEAAAPIAAQLKTWLGPGPNQPLLLLDHAGEPFEDDALLVGKLSAMAKPENVAPELVRGLTHAWFDPLPPTHLAPENTWIGDGLAELMALVATENLLGRDRAIAQLQQAYVLLALSEPVLHDAGVSSSSAPATPAPPAPDTSQPSESQGPVAPQPLTAAYSDAFLRYKSLAVLWQLREQLGEDTLQRCLTAYRHSLALNPALWSDSQAFERSLERTSGHDLAWFFNDWVYHDRGLPDLSLGQVNARALPVGTGKYAGYLVAIEVHNDGGAVADVPVTVSSETLTASQRMRVEPHSSASLRIVFEGTPTQVQVNDGSVPEVGALVHTVQIATDAPSGNER
jgi:hypothetical protein